MKNRDNSLKDNLTRQMILEYISHKGAVVVIATASIVVGCAVVTFLYYLGKSLIHLIS